LLFLFDAHFAFCAFFAAVGHDSSSRYFSPVARMVSK
jgi:hypothetical protein